MENTLKKQQIRIYKPNIKWDGVQASFHLFRAWVAAIAAFPASRAAMKLEKITNYSRPQHKLISAVGVTPPTDRSRLDAHTKALCLPGM